MRSASYTFRYHITEADLLSIHRILSSTRMFRDDEIAVALELAKNSIAQGPLSEYEFIFLDEGKKTIGYVCYGPIACTLHRYDLYWIAVNRTRQQSGYGRALMEECERIIAQKDGISIYADTSGRLDYLPTRAFYERMGYRKEAVIPDFFHDGDDKIIYSKKLPQGKPTLKVHSERTSRMAASMA